MKNNSTKKIVLIIRGGVLQEAYSNSKDINIELLDVDNHENETKQNIDALYLAAKKDLSEVGVISL